MFDLIRFFEKKEYVTDFLNGNFYMNSIGHFWGLSSAVQNDIAEGIGESMDTESFMNKYYIQDDKNSDVFIEEFLLEEDEKQ